MTTHRHTAQPTRRRIENKATQEQRSIGPNSWRCWSVAGDPAVITDYCRCGASRETPAVFEGTPSHDLGSGDLKPTAKPGEWR